MKCDMCGGETEIRRVETYRYRECGLENVYLENIEVERCPACNLETALIPNILELHATIARAVALQPYPLAGAEVRFLRKQLGLKAKAWAVYLHIDHTTLSRWETGEQKIGPQSDTLVRLLYFRLLEERGEFSADEPIVGRVTSAVDAVRVPGGKMVVNASRPQAYSYT